MLAIRDEFSRLQQVIIGLGAPFQRDKKKVAAQLGEFPLIPDTDRKAEVLALSYPTEAILQQEFADYVAVLERYGINVLRADPSAAYSFDYTCPRDIGFVVGDVFFMSNMAVPSRSDEIKTIRKHLSGINAESIVQPPGDCIIEGGDVVVLDSKTVLVGHNQRSNMKGVQFLKRYLSPLGITVQPVPHRQLHLDCCLNSLGLGHLLIHPDSLTVEDEAVWQALKRYKWIEIDAVEREHLATNILSIDSGTVIARDHEECKRVNAELKRAGYMVETTQFDGVPATGGSFRCASLPLYRSANAPSSA